MTKTMMGWLVGVGVVVAGIAMVASTVSAEPGRGRGEGRGEGRQACAEDVERLCSGLEGRHEIGRCLAENRDDLSASCQAHVDKRMEKRAEHKARLEAACGQDAQALCPGLEGRELMACMKDHKDELSDQCRDTVKEMKHRRGRHHGPGREAREAIKAACQSDAQALCPGLEKRELMECMKDHRDELSNQCTEAIESAHQRRGERRGERRGDR